MYFFPSLWNMQTTPRFTIDQKLIARVIDRTDTETLENRKLLQNIK
jgi:hypothetical protein